MGFVAGYGENSRVLKWMCNRYDNKCEGQMSAIGVVPAPGELDLDGLTVDTKNMKDLMTVLCYFNYFLGHFI